MKSHRHIVLAQQAEDLANDARAVDPQRFRRMLRKLAEAVRHSDRLRQEQFDKRHAVVKFHQESIGHAMDRTFKHAVMNGDLRRDNAELMALCVKLKELNDALTAKLEISPPHPPLRGVDRGVMLGESRSDCGGASPSIYPPVQHRTEVQP